MQEIHSIYLYNKVTGKMETFIGCAKNKSNALNFAVKFATIFYMKKHQGMINKYVRNRKLNIDANFKELETSEFVSKYELEITNKEKTLPLDNFHVMIIKSHFLEDEEKSNKRYS